MEDINEIFITALKLFVKQIGTQRELATKAGISAQYLNDILQGKSHGNEKTRRKIATALGYQGADYEKFLDVGRGQKAYIPLMVKNTTLELEADLLRDDKYSIEQKHWDLEDDYEKLKNRLLQMQEKVIDLLEEGKVHSETITRLADEIRTLKTDYAAILDENTRLENELLRIKSPKITKKMTEITEDPFAGTLLKPAKPKPSRRRPARDDDFPISGVNAAPGGESTDTQSSED